MSKVDAHQVLKALLKDPDLAWQVGLLLGSANLAGPWVYDEGSESHFRAELPRGPDAKPVRVVSTRKGATTQGNPWYWLAQGHGGFTATVPEAKQASDAALIHEGWKLVGGPYMAKPEDAE